MRYQSNDELDWLAFRYVTGEMTADEQEQFEARLGEDQLAREAVERAVELNEAVRLVSPGSVPVPGSRVRLAIRRRLAWGAMTAASLVLVAGLVWLSTGSQQPVVQNDAARSLPNAIALTPEDSAALAWVYLRHEQQGEPFAPENSWTTTVSEGQLGEIETDFEDAEETEPSVPEWLLSVFSAETGHQGSP